MYPTSTLKVLIVEDNDRDAELSQMILEDSDIDCEIDKVKNGLEAVRRLKFESPEWPDLVLLDLDLPILDGREVLKVIKETEGLRTLPVFILTGSPSTKDRELCLKLGCAAFLQKPQDLDGFEPLLQHMAKLAASRLDRRQACH